MQAGQNAEELTKVEHVLGRKSALVLGDVVVELRVSLVDMVIADFDAVDRGDRINEIVGFINDDDLVFQVDRERLPGFGLEEDVIRQADDFSRRY